MKKRKIFHKKNSQTHRDVILKRTKVYYENDKKRLAEEAKNNIKNYLKEKNIKREYGRNRYNKSK